MISGCHLGCVSRVVKVERTARRPGLRKEGWGLSLTKCDETVRVDLAHMSWGVWFDGPVLSERIGVIAQKISK